MLEEKERFEQKIAIRPLVPKKAESEEELEELCRLAGEVPSLWEHESVTHQERKDILRCIIDHIVVAATKERIDATIFWKSGSQTPLSMWRGPGRHNLIRELYAQNLTVREIREHLAAGKTSTGQVIQISRNKLRFILHKLGLKPNRYPASYVSLRQKAAELNREGRSMEWIAEHFNEQGFTSPKGKSWTPRLVYDLIVKVGEKMETLGDIHRKEITEARARG